MTGNMPRRAPPTSSPTLLTWAMAHMPSVRQFREKVCDSVSMVRSARCRFADPKENTVKSWALYGRSRLMRPASATTRVTPRKSSMEVARSVAAAAKDMPMLIRKKNMYRIPITTPPMAVRYEKNSPESSMSCPRPMAFRTTSRRWRRAIQSPKRVNMKNPPRCWAVTISVVFGMPNRLMMPIWIVASRKNTQMLNRMFSSVKNPMPMKAKLILNWIGGKDSARVMGMR